MWLLWMRRLARVPHRLKTCATACLIGGLPVFFWLVGGTWWVVLTCVGSC